MRLRSFAIACLALLSTSALAEKSSYDFDSRVYFASFATYAWESDPTEDSNFNHQRIVRAIEGELAAKRLARVGRDAQPDLLVAYRVGFERSVRVTSTAYRFASPATTRVRPTLEGALLIELYDAHTGAVVWRGYAVREIDIDADPAQRERNIARTVRKVLKSYPPKR